MLTHGLLDQLERRWRAQRWPGVERLRPGLTREQMDVATTPLGLRLPLEARRWWGWHDGIAVAPSGRASRRVFGGPGYGYLTLADAVAIYQRQRAVAATLGIDSRADGFGQDDWWHPSWFPLTESASGQVIACDCSVPEGEPTPIRSIGWGVDPGFSFATPRVMSFGQLVSWWIDAIDRGAWGYEPAEERWRRDYSKLDPERELKRVV